MCLSLANKLVLFKHFNLKNLSNFHNCCWFGLTLCFKIFNLVNWICWLFSVIFSPTQKANIDYIWPVLLLSDVLSNFKFMLRQKNEYFLSTNKLCWIERLFYEYKEEWAPLNIIMVNNIIWLVWSNNSILAKSKITLKSSK